MISKLRWIIHPYCWSMQPGSKETGSVAPADGDPVLYFRILAWERAVHTRHLEMVYNMKPDEALVIYPVEPSEPMDRLIRVAQKTLGRRCIIIGSAAVSPRFLNKEPKAMRMRAFLDKKYPEEHKKFIQAALGKAYGLRQIPGLAEEIEAEIRAAYEVKGDALNDSCLKVIYYSRVLAIEITEKLKAAGLTFDPKTVEGEAFGEGFEQCAMTWKAMLPKYMGLSKPIENDFDLSVSGAAFLIGARLHERVAKDNEVRIFLWMEAAKNPLATREEAQQRPIALFARAAATFGDPQYYVRIPLQGLTLQLQDVQNRVLWPKNESTPSNIVETEGFLQVPVYAATRQAGDGCFYVLGPAGMSFDHFRDIMVNAKITSQ